MAGGIPYQGIDFQGILATYFNAKDAAERRNTQREEMEWRKQERQYELDQQKATSEAAAQERASLADMILSGGNVPKEHVSFVMQNPQGYAKWQQDQQSQEKQRFEMEQAQAASRAEQDTAAANLQRTYANAPPEARGGIIESAKRMQGRGRLPEGFNLEVPEMAPDQAAMFQQQLTGGADAVLGAEKPDPAKTTSDITEYEAISGIPRSDPRFGPGFGKWLEKMSKSRATQINMPGEGSSRAKLEQSLEKGEILLGRIADIRSYGDPSRFLGLKSKVANFTLSKIADVAPSLLDEGQQQAVADARQFKEDVDQVYLESKVEITGASGAEKELAEIRGTVLSTDLNTPEFNASLDRLERVTRRNMDIRRRLLERGVDLGTADGMRRLDAEISRARQAEQQKKPAGGGPRPKAVAPPPNTKRADIEALARQRGWSPAQLAAALKQAGVQ